MLLSSGYCSISCVLLVCKIVNLFLYLYLFEVLFFGIFLRASVDFFALFYLMDLLCFQNIDVDHIVEQYQSSCTPKPSISKLPPITPSIDKDNTARQEVTCLPPELCINCSHGFKVCI